MKVLLASAAIAASLAFAAPASAQNYGSWQSINARQAQLDQRIDLGVRNGSLTRGEATQLRGEFRQIALIESRYRINGLTLAERRDLDRRFDLLSARIRYERQDRQDRGQWVSINQRQANLDRRIDAGVRTGDLTRGEAQRLRAEFRNIAFLENRYRRSGAGLTLAERRDLDARFDRLSARIRYERADYQDRNRRN